MPFRVSAVARGAAVALGLALVAWAGIARAMLADFPGPVRGWETVPGVVRADGLERFRVEVDVNGPVAGVTLTGISPCLDPAPSRPLALRDDGRHGDRVAGDGIFTSVAFRYTCDLPETFRSDPSSPAGVDILDVGTVGIAELDGTVSEFLGNPAIGLLRADLPPARTIALSPDVVVAPHLINVRSMAHQTQRFLRFPDDQLAALTTRIYPVVPDAFDFLIFFSTDKVERRPATFNRNFVAGSHRSVNVNFTGTGQVPVDHTALYGSKGRLLGVNVLDAYGRGIVANVATHEIQHQWVAYIRQSLGLSDGIHYGPLTSAGSLIGGFRWLAAGEGTYICDCSEGRSGAFHAAALDKYMMGLIHGRDVPPMRVAVGPSFGCGEPVGPVASTVTIRDIQAVHGVRRPGPSAAQRDFALAFVAESHGRLLDPTETTFYEILAAHYTAPIPASAPDPYQGSGQWASIARFFGEGTTWRGEVSTCGNGTIERDEECDDGNTDAGDGCSPSCQREVGEVVLRARLGEMPSIDPRRNGLFTVAVLSARALDPLTIDVGTVRFGPAGTEATPVSAMRRDVDRDGRVDLELRFHIQRTGLTCHDPRVLLSGRTVTGQPFVGRGEVTLLGCR